MNATSEQSAASPHAMTRLQAGLLVIVGTVGTLLRGRVLAMDRPLWLDEALLATNTCGRSWRELLEPLDYQQGAPLGFLLAESGMVSLLGPNEFALRLVPCLASVASLLVIAHVIRRHVGPTAAVFGLSAAAVLPSLLYYAGEAKPYSVDVLISLVLLDLGAGTLRRGLSLGRTVLLAVVGAAAVWSSYPSAFVLAVIALLVVRTELRAKRVDGVVLGIGLLLLWLVNFVLMYRISARALNQSAFLNEFWHESFLIFPPRSAEDWRQYLSMFIGLFETMYKDAEAGSSTAQRMSVAAALVWLAGLAALIRGGKRELVALCVGPLLVAAGAAAFHKYPLRDRLCLFTVGPLLVVMAAGVESAWRSPDPLARVIGRIFVVVLLALPVMQTAQAAAAPRPSRSARAAMEQLARDWRPGDICVTVSVSSGQLIPFYRDFGQLDDLARIAPIIHAADALDLEAKAGADGILRAYPRVWIVYSGRIAAEGVLPDIQRVADRLGTRLQTIEANRCWFALYRFDRTWQGG